MARLRDLASQAIIERRTVTVLPSGALCANALFPIPTFDSSVFIRVCCKKGAPSLSRCSYSIWYFILITRIAAVISHGRTIHCWTTISILGDSEEIQEGDIASVISILDGLPRCPLDNASAGDILRQYGWMIGGFHIRHPEHFAQHGQTYVDERLHRHSLSCDTILIHVYQEPSSIFQRPPLLYSPRDDDT